MELYNRNFNNGVFVMDFTDYLKKYPDANGYFGKYGGAYLPEKLILRFSLVHKAGHYSM